MDHLSPALITTKKKEKKQGKRIRLMIRSWSGGLCLLQMEARKRHFLVLNVWLNKKKLWNFVVVFALFSLAWTDVLENVPLVVRSGHHRPFSCCVSILIIVNLLQSLLKVQTKDIVRL